MKHILLMAIIWLPFMSYAQITGTLNDNQGAPLSGCKVYVLGYNDTAESNSSGQFSIAKTGISFFEYKSSEIAFHSQSLLFSLEESSPVRIEIRTINNQVAANIWDGLLKKGEHTMSLQQANLPSGLYTLSLHIEKNKIQAPFMWIGGKAYSSTDPKAQRRPLSKLTQQSDTLFVDCDGLAPATKAVSSGNEDLGIITVPRYNVLFLSIDDLNDWTGFLGGHPQAITPNMDKLAARGLNFTNAHCPAPGCSPSRNAMLFGIEPHNSGLYPFYNLDEVDAEVLEPFTALSQLFRENGYYACGLTKVFHSSDANFKKDIFWDEYVSYPRFMDYTLIRDDSKYYIPEEYDVSGDYRLVAAPSEEGKEEFRDYKSAIHAVEFIGRSHNQPFFLAVGINRPHTPFVVPLENFDRFDMPIEEPPFKADDLVDIPLAGRSNAQIYVEIPMRRDEAWERSRRGYLASINFSDDNVGRVLDALDNSPYSHNTIIVLWSDHGFHLGEKRHFSKFSLWNEATRTPFVIYDPKARNGHGKETHESVGTINLYRTLADMTGLSAPDYVDGFSLRPWVYDPAKPMEQLAPTTWGRGNYTLRSKEWRYTRYYDGSEELYDEIVDPNEWTNLAEDPQYAAQKQLFQQWLPRSESPQVTSGVALYNVADADSEDRIDKFKNKVRGYNNQNLQPPLGFDY